MAAAAACCRGEREEECNEAEDMREGG